MRRARATDTNLRNFVAAGLPTCRDVLGACVLLAVAAAAGGAADAPEPAPAEKASAPKTEETPWVPERTVRGPSGPTWPGLPIAVTVTYRNTLGRPARVPDWWVYRVTVRRADAADPPQVLWVRAVSATASPPTVLDPGKTCTRTALAVIGWRENASESPPVLLFPEPGRYTVEGDGWGDGAPMAVTVEATPAPDDRDARRLWSADVAACLAGETARLAAAMPLIDRICEGYPLSPYAGWALWLKAESAARRAAEPRALAGAVHACEIILERHPEMPLRDRVLERLAILRDQGLQRERARETAGELARTFPESERLAALKQSRGVLFAPSASAQPAPPALPAAALSLAGLEVVPQGPRRAFEAFCRAVAEGRAEAIEAMLPRDFMGDFGPRGRYVWKLVQERRGATAGEMRFAVRKASLAQVYARPLSLPFGDERTWHGPVCVLEGTVTARWATTGRGGEATLDAPLSSWVLYEYPRGAWKVVSEICANRHLAAGAAGQKLARDLSRTFATWEVSDGARTRRPYEEVKRDAGLAGKTADARTEWRTHAFTMAGRGNDEVLLVGRASMLLAAGAGDPETEHWVGRDVRMLLVLADDGALVLKELSSVAAAVPPPGGPPGR